MSLLFIRQYKTLHPRVVFDCTTSFILLTQRYGTPCLCYYDQSGLLPHGLIKYLTDISRLDTTYKDYDPAFVAVSFIFINSFSEAFGRQKADV
jgi:hypothetical protein